MLENSRVLDSIIVTYVTEAGKMVEVGLTCGKPVINATAKKIFTQNVRR